MNKKIISLYLVIVVFFLSGIILPGCKDNTPEYNYKFDYSPPYINARLNEVFPSQIFKQLRKTEKMDFPEGTLGYIASYGEGIKMTVVKFQTPEEAEQYFDETVAPGFREYPRSSVANLNNQKQAFGSFGEEGQSVAWVNTIWVFILEGSDEKNYDVVVRACRFISRELKK